MATTGTYAFNPAFGELVLTALSRCGVRGSDIQQHHVEMARIEANTLLSRWSVRGVNLWTIDLQTVILSQGTTVVPIPEETISVLDAYLETTDGTTTTSRPIMPLSRTEYAMLPDKTRQGFPTNYWFNRLDIPEMRLWPIPDANGTYTLKYYRMRQAQDIDPANASQVEVPYRWIDAFLSGLAGRLSIHFAPQMAPAFAQEAEAAWGFASDAETENVPIYITPMLGGYYR